MISKKKEVWPYLLVAPAVTIMVLIVFVPVINALGMSFQSYDLRNPNNIAFIGLQNYREIFSDYLFWGALGRTFIWVFFGVGLQFFFGFILALILNHEFRGRGMIRSLSMVPWVTPGVLIGLMWRWIFDGNFGVLNDLLLKLNLIDDKIPFLAQTSTALPCVITAIVWQGIPFFALMILAGLQQIPKELYEASSIDGANKFFNLFYVTIPSIKNTIGVTLLLRIIWVANSVDVIFNMTGGGPAYSTQTLSVYVYNKGNTLNLGYASGMAICLAILLALVAIPYVRATFRGTE